MNIYVVIGTTGEYSDHREWPVAAYFSEKLAQAHVIRATQRANELYAQAGGYCDKIPDGANEHDPDTEVYEWLEADKSNK